MNKVDKVTYIYLLSDPLTNEIRYVGQTGDPGMRYEQHISRSANRPHVGEWIGELKKVGAAPVMILVEECSKKEARKVEQNWITKCLFDGADLLNYDGLLHHASYRRIWGLSS